MKGAPVVTQRLEVIRRELAEGYGVEDIAVRNGYSAEHIRAYVAHLRDAGKLERLLSRVGTADD